MNTFKVFRVRPSAWSACGCVMEVRDASASCFCNSGSLALLLTVPMMATRCVPVVHLKLVTVVLRGKLFFLQLVWKLLSHWIDFCFKHALIYISKQLIPVHPCHFQRETQRLNLCYLQPDSMTALIAGLTPLLHSSADNPITHDTHLILVSTRSNLLARFISTLSVDPEHTRNPPPSPCDLTHLLGSLSSTQLYSACQASSSCSLF